MKKQSLPALLYQLASPVALMVLGLILLLDPDSAAALLSRLLGWVVTLVLMVYAIFTFVNWPKKGAVRVCILLVSFGVSTMLLNSPLLLAKNVGRFLGVLILLRGLRDMALSRSNHRGETLALATIAAGILLILLPMTASRLIFRICGGVILAVGVAMVIDRLKNRKYLDGGDKNIIDAL